MHIMQPGLTLVTNYICNASGTKPHFQTHVPWPGLINVIKYTCAEAMTNLDAA